MSRTRSIQKRIDNCPNLAAHVKDEPSGYLDWHEWAAKKRRTHKQTRCPGCGLYVIWKRRS